MVQNSSTDRRIAIHSTLGFEKVELVAVRERTLAEARADDYGGLYLPGGIINPTSFGSTLARSPCAGLR